MTVLLAKERILKLIQAWEEKQIKSWSLPELLPQLLNDSRAINEMLKQRKQVANLVVQQEQKEQAAQSFTPYWNFSMIDDEEVDDDAFEDIKYVEASLPDSKLVSLKEENNVYQEEKEFDLKYILQIQGVILREKLLSINRLIDDIEFLNNNPTPDRVFKSSSLFPIFEKSNNFLSYSDNSLPKFETFSDHTEETRSGNTTAHANNSLPEYDSFCFEIEPDQGRLTSVVMNDISDNSTNDPLLEEVDLFLASDNLIPSGIENIDYDSEGDIYFLKDFLSNDSLPLPKNKSSNFIIMMILVKSNIDELNEDECFDTGGDIDVFEDDDYFPFIFVIRIFLPYLIYPEVSPLLLSTRSEDTIFDPGIST
nr:hypothetical protein [Tanacetum cinerariifolium]